MDRPVIPIEFEQAIRAVSVREGIQLSYDTHYDAGNFELRWWSGKILNRLDFQPSNDRIIRVTWLKDSFPMLPKLMHWGRRYIPYFPYTARTEHIVFGQIHSGKTKETYEVQILEYLQKAA